MGSISQNIKKHRKIINKRLYRNKKRAKTFPFQHAGKIIMITDQIITASASSRLSR